MKKPKCKGCPYYVYTRTLSSMEIPEWHCEHGYRPYRNKDNFTCVDECKRWERIVDSWKKDLEKDI